MYNRRQFLTGSSLVAASAVGFPHLAQSEEKKQQKPGQKPRHIIHLVADGMSTGTLTCADHLSSQLRERGLTWMQLFNHPHVHAGWMNMRSSNSLVTDSSAASSSWGSGSRIRNAAVNQLRDGTKLTTLYELLGQQGWKRGLVTTTEITHATPAGFATCVKHRDRAQDIAQQYLQRTIDVLAGGGHKYFRAKDRKDKRDLLKDFRLAGYHVSTNRDEFLAGPADKRWLGVFTDGHLPFTIDRNESKKLQGTVPSLAEMTRAALAKLERENHFILQVEGGRVDHACHNNDAAGALHDQIAFDEAIDVAVGFQKRHPETLIVITTDHGNANLGLNGTGSSYANSNKVFRNVARIRASFEVMRDDFKRKVNLPDPKDAETRKNLEIAVTPEELADRIQHHTGYKVPIEKAALFRKSVAGNGESMYDMMKDEKPMLGQLLANYTGISFTGTAHTADYVPITALGPGAERFRGFIDNTDVFHHYMALTGIDFKNPTESLLTEVGPTAHDAEFG